MTIGLTDNDWLHLLKAVEIVEKKGIHVGKWEEIHSILPQKLKSRTTKDGMRYKWNELSCELNGNRKVKRNMEIISPKILEMVKKYKASTKAAPTATPEGSPRKRYRQNEGHLHEVKSYRPYRSSKRGKPNQELELEALDARVAVKPNLQNEVGLHEVNKDPSITFIKYYQVEASEFAKDLDGFLLPTCRNMILDQIEKELGLEKFNALLKKCSEECSRSASREEASKTVSPVEVAFRPAFARFRSSILGVLKSSTDVLADEVIKEVLIRNLRD